METHNTLLRSGALAARRIALSTFGRGAAAAATTALTFGFVLAVIPPLPGPGVMFTLAQGLHAAAAVA